VNLTGFKFGEVEHLIDQIQETYGVPMHLIEQIRLIFRHRTDITLSQALKGGDYGREWCPDFVADVGKELGFHPIKLLQFIIRRCQIVSSGELFDVYSA
jgi:hypothetical protein